MKFYIGISLIKETKTVLLIGIGKNESKALKYAKKDNISKAFCISNPKDFHKSLEIWLSEETDMVATEIKDFIQILIKKIQNKNYNDESFKFINEYKFDN